MSLLLAVIAADVPIQSVSTPTSGAVGRKRRKGRRVFIRDREYDSVIDAQLIAYELEAWTREIEARAAPQHVLTGEAERVTVETSVGKVSLPVFVPLYAEGEFERVQAALRAIDAKRSEMRAWAEALRQMQQDEDDAEILLLH